MCPCWFDDAGTLLYKHLEIDCDCCMKIVIAAWHLKNFNVGIGRYSRELIEAIGRVDQAHCYEVLVPDDSYRFPDRPNIRYRLIRFPLFRGRFWIQAAPLLAHRHDVLHIPYDSCVAFKRGKLITTVHDIKPLLFPVLAQHHNIKSMFEQALIGDKWGRIDHVVTISECSKRDIVTHLKVPEHRLTVVYPGVDLNRFQPAERPPRISNVELPTHSVRPYVLTVGGADPTKNLEVLIDAFARLPGPLRDAYDLMLVGDLRGRQHLREQVRYAGLEKQTHFAGIVTDERLIELYQQATLFVFPTLYEGFGLPVLEAMACGTPVLCSNVASLPEVAGDAAILFDPLDRIGLSAIIRQVLSDDDLRRQLTARGRQQASKFSWDDTARRMVSVYEHVAQGLCQK